MNTEIIEQEIQEKKNLIVLCGKGSNKVVQSYKESFYPNFIQYPEYGLDPSEVAKRIIEIVDQSKVGIFSTVIHTHNDHVINGIMIQCYLRFKELKKENPNLTIGISNENVSILFIDNEQIVKVPITETGRIPKPPVGFFRQFNIDMKRLLTGE